MDTKIFTGNFFENYLSLTHYQTLFAIAALLISFYIIKKLQDKKVSFSLRMFAGLGMGIVLGLGIQCLTGFQKEPLIWMQETATWYGLFGRIFISFIRMLVIPLVFVSIVKVIIDFSGQKDLPKIAFRGIFWLLFTTGIACIIGILLGNIFSLGYTHNTLPIELKGREMTNLVDTFVNLVPSNIVSAMNTENIIGLVIFSALIGLGANRMEKKNPEAIGLFKKLIEGLYKIVMSVTMTIIKYMPYAVIALLSKTIISNGIPAIMEVSGFVLSVYIAAILMLLIHVLLVSLHGISPLLFVKKSVEVWLMGFTSRSSVGTLPLTIATLTERMGVSSGTANLIGSLGSTMGMNGCAGFFPALIAIMVAHMIGIPMDAQFYIMLVIVVVIGSIGVAGIPGTATIAATIVLSGMGLGEYFPLIGMVLAIDPIIDMPRTMANVSGSLTSAVIVDKETGNMNMNIFNDPDVILKD
ncbi:cation:dicarboxylate symporter family transporter [Apibacter sp. HY039]|uniref:cation:dicarboxylate symporter family transporter n=1 Tax=Apibacter sp. HY039 TaxID=2501476 RepID=UPI000FEC0C45|nr:cation:dicarboxylase symporter family transporter [Apibacter sp. HY039]